MPEKIIPLTRHDYEFTVILHGNGETPELAWFDAVKNFMKRPDLLRPDLVNTEEDL
jgi:hypothetical protein